MLESIENKIDFIPDSHSILISIFYEYVREHGNLWKL